MSARLGTRKWGGFTPPPTCTCLIESRTPTKDSRVHTTQQVLPSCPLHGHDLTPKAALWLAAEEDAAHQAAVIMHGDEDRWREILTDRLALLHETHAPAPRGGRHAERRP